MKIGYIRVSTTGQEIARQETIMMELGVEKIYIDKLSGKDTNRPSLNEMLEFAREGDILIVESYSRLSRSLKDLLDIVEQLRSKGVGFISKKENFDTTTPSGKLMLGMFASLAEYEREILLQRQKEGLAECRKRGQKLGRKMIEIDHKVFSAVIKKWKNKEVSATQAMQELGLKPNTFYRMVKKMQIKQL